MQNVYFATGYKKKPEIPDIKPVKNTQVYQAYSTAVDRRDQILREQYELAERQRKAAMDATIKANNRAASESFRDAYVSNMLTKRNLPQQLKALGVSGGRSESTLTDIENTYMNNRMGIQKRRSDANAQARAAYNSGVAGDYSNYLTGLYNLEDSRMKALADKADSETATSGSTEGFQIGGTGKIYTESNKMDLLNDLVSKGLTLDEARRYLKSQGLM